jgi:hypothetical protein
MQNKWLDPSVELLGRQFLFKLLKTFLPKELHGDDSVF